MVQVNLTTPYAIVNFVKVQSINIDPIKQKIYASVYYYYSKNNVDYAVAPVQYNNSAEGRMGIEMIPASVVLQGDEYINYNTYIGQGKTPEEAVLQILLDKNVIAGTLV